MHKSHKFHSLEGLRGVAAFMVVVWHLHLTFFSESGEPQINQGFIPHFATNLFLTFPGGLYNGTFAVWIFWILSGFVLSLQFFLRVEGKLSEHAHDYLEDAFLRRYPRLLLPVLASVLCAYLLMVSHLMYNKPFSQALGEPYASGWISQCYSFPPSLLGAIKSACWDTFFDFRAADTYNNVLWTMERELYGSMFLFAFLGLVGRRSSRFLLYPLIALANLKLPCHWLDTFVAGIALSDLYVNRASVWWVQYLLRWPILRLARGSAVFAIMCWILIIAAIGFSAGFPYDTSVYLVMGFCAVALTLVSTSTQHVLSSAIPMFLGRISFGLYLVHVPLICSFSCYGYLACRGSLGPWFAALSVSGVTCILSVIFGYCLYALADKPSIQISRLFSKFVMDKVKRFLWRSAGSDSPPAGMR